MTSLSEESSEGSQIEGWVVRDGESLILPMPHSF
jgi:hypothetical protein